MAGVMMALGDYRFSLDTAAFEALQRQTQYRWVGQERLGRESAFQYLGPGEDTIDFSGVIYPHFRGGLGQVDAMRAEAAKGVALLLVDGRGGVWGNYVIKSISETRSMHFDDGTPRRVEFSLSLTKYGDDGETGSAAVVSATSAAPAAAITQTSALSSASAISEAWGAVGGLGATLGATLGIAAEAVTTVVDAVQAVGVTVDAAIGAVNVTLGNVTSIVTSVGQELPGLAAVGVDSVSAALSYLPCNVTAVTTGLAAVGIEATDFAAAFIASPAATLINVAESVAALPGDVAAEVAGQILPGRGADTVLAIGRNAAAARAAAGLGA